MQATPTELLRRFVTTSRKLLISKKRTVSGRRTGVLINCVLVTIFVEVLVKQLAAQET